MAMREAAVDEMAMAFLRAIGATAIFVASAATGCGGAPALPASSSSQLLRHPMPRFQRPTLDGATFDTSAHTDGVVVVKFFAQYCEPCRRTLPAAEKLHRDRPDIVFVGISEDESDGVARELVQRHGLTFPVVHDAGNVL